MMMNAGAPASMGLGQEPTWGSRIGDWISTVLGKIQVPGFGTPSYEPGTFVEQITPTGTYIAGKQPSGLPVPVVAGQMTATTSTGTGLVLGAVAVVILAVVLLGKRR